MSLNFHTSLNIIRTSSSTTTTTSNIATNNTILKQCLITQTKGYFNYFHENSKTNLIHVLDNERWEQYDIPIEKQKLIDRLISGRLFLSDKQIENTENSDKSKTTHDVITPVVIDGSIYKVVYSVMYLIDILFNYLEISISFTSITTDVITKTGEILTLFDTRVKQLVLGAQAIQTSARLKSISAKHLCLTAQSLGLLGTILPHVRTAFLTQLPSKHHILLTGIDRVSASLLEHHGLIFSKFIDIVNDFVDSSALKLPNTVWDVTTNTKETTTIPYFDEIAKNISALHRVLDLFLPIEQVQDVFSRIFTVLHRKMLHHFENIKPTSQSGKQRIVDEVSHLVLTISKLKKIDMSTFGVLEEAFQTRYLVQ
jgi:vacuolar protein sorting-associated protein 54